MNRIAVFIENCQDTDRYRERVMGRLSERIAIYKLERETTITDVADLDLKLPASNM